MLTNDNMINVSAQLLMKIKYVVYLLGKTHSSDEQLLEDMA